MAEVHPWPKATGVPAAPPRPMTVAADHTLAMAWHALEAQLGTVEAYNRIVALASRQHARIARGDVKAQLAIYATEPALRRPVPRSIEGAPR